MLNTFSDAGVAAPLGPRGVEKRGVVTTAKDADQPRSLQLFLMATWEGQVNV